MEVQQLLLRSFISLAVVGMLGLLAHLYNAIVARPRKLRSILKKQGINGPPATLLLGNLLDVKRAIAMAAKAPIFGAPTRHSCTSATFPFIEQWQKRYGQVFMFSLGTTPILHVNQHDMVREFATCTSLDLGKPSQVAKDLKSLLGQGVLTSNGTRWIHQRKIIAPELCMDKVKGIVEVIQECAITTIDSWQKIIDETQGGIADIKVDEQMRKFSRDVISKLCFGSSYSVGEEMFSKIRGLYEAASKRNIINGIPGMKYLPTKSNREAWALTKEIETSVLKGVKQSSEKNLLSMIFEGAKNSELSSILDRFIVDNFKTIYVAGYETSAVTLSWCLMLLASNPEWQERVRIEVLQICDGQIPDADMIRKMKLMTMVINETFRLYPPAPVMSREALKDMKLGDLYIPKGVNIWSFVLTLHTDPDAWGPDSYQFNPERFVNGITGACRFPHLFMPFGIGPRVCLGQSLAWVEMKILLALILANFSFTLSPTYIHSPMMHLVILPEHGVNLYVKKL